MLPAESTQVVAHRARGPAGGDVWECELDPGGPGPGGTPKYQFHRQKVSVLINDVPVGYTPPVGRAVKLNLSYDHRESRHPQTIDYGSVGPKWSHNWLSRKLPRSIDT